VSPEITRTTQMSQRSGRSVPESRTWPFGRNCNLRFIRGIRAIRGLASVIPPALNRMDEADAVMAAAARAERTLMCGDDFVDFEVREQESHCRPRITRMARIESQTLSAERTRCHT
jgi:hypothetical protein